MKPPALFCACLAAPVLGCLALGALAAHSAFQADPGTADALAPLPGSGTGIFLQSHRVNPWLPFEHSLLRICPSRQEEWMRAQPRLFRLKDAQGLAFLTLAAGTDEKRLIFAVDRYWDVAKRPSASRRLKFESADEEDRAIQKLLSLCLGYRHGLAFAKWPGVTGEGYNCNSFFSGLLSAAALPGGMSPLWRYPGLRHPVPPREFSFSTASAPGRGAL